MKQIIYAISFLHKGERVVIEATKTGRFKVPVTDVIAGALKTRFRPLTALEVLEHKIIKHCDPTLYLANNERMRVYPGGDPSYLPAQVEGIAVKHDEANKIELPKFKNSKTNKGKFNTDRYSSSNTNQSIGMDLHGWWPNDYDDGYAD